MALMVSVVALFEADSRKTSASGLLQDRAAAKAFPHAFFRRRTLLPAPSTGIGKIGFDRDA